MTDDPSQRPLATTLLDRADLPDRIRALVAGRPEFIEPGKVTAPRCTDRDRLTQQLDDEHTEQARGDVERSGFSGHTALTLFPDRALPAGRARSMMDSEGSIAAGCVVSP